MSNDISCRTCKYWNPYAPSTNPLDNTNNMGRCQRYPPVLVMTGTDNNKNTDYSEMFPDTSNDMWCGEYVSVNKYKETEDMV